MFELIFFCVVILSILYIISINSSCLYSILGFVFFYPFWISFFNIWKANHIKIYIQSTSHSPSKHPLQVNIFITFCFFLPVGCFIFSQKIIHIYIFICRRPYSPFFLLQIEHVIYSRILQFSLTNVSLKFLHIKS